jgi:phage terminase large subunit-like protein
MSELSRRAFAESLAVAVLAPMVGVSPETVRIPPWDARAQSGTAANPGALARALTQAIRAQYGSRLSAKDLATIATQIQSGLERIDRLRKVPLTNGDEPDFVFSAARRPGSAR